MSKRNLIISSRQAPTGLRASARTTAYELTGTIACARTAEGTITTATDEAQIRFGHVDDAIAVAVPK